MSTKKKLFLSAAGAAGGAGLDVDEVFSTYLYEGQSAFSVVNGIDMAANGGLVWIKNRDYTKSHRLFSTGLTNLGHHLEANSTNGEANLSTQGITSFNSNGWSVGTGNSETNASGWGDYVSWTFRKAPKFFDVVTYTGDGTAGRTISHNLGTTVGSIFIKRTDASSGWRVFHRSEGGTKYAMLQSTNAFASASTVWNNTNPTDSVFTVGSDTDTNGSGGSFVAYLFAHNDGDGEFGPDSDQDIIKCGSYTGNGSTTGPEINLGFEPQWVIVKNATSAASWNMFDIMRGLATGSGDTLKRLYADTSGAESNSKGLEPTSTGFKLTQAYSGINASSANYIYMAIRRGPLAEPTSATDVFAMDDRSGGPPNAVSGFPVDMGLHTNLTSNDNRYINARLIQGKRLFANLTSVEGSSSEAAFDYMTGFIDRSDTSTDNIHYMWKRAPSFFDVVTYTGDGTGGSRQITHNLGATPQWVMVKPRSDIGNWINWFAPFGDDHYFTLTQYGRTDTAVFFNTADSTSFTLGTGGSMNNSGTNYIVFLFGSLSGISKVGTYTGNGTNQNIDCGFSSGARFVLIRQDIDSVSTSDWFIYDTFRGLVAGNDKRLELNTTDLQDTDTDSIDPYSAGFNVVQESEANLNVSGQTYVFYAIA